MSKLIQLKDNENNNVYPIEEPYSTTEQRIGTWTDGKPVYRKTIVFTNAISTNTTTLIGSVNNPKDIIDLKITLRNSNATSTFALNGANTSSILYTQVNLSNGNIYVTSNDSWSSPKIICHIEYTKTTD